MRAIGWNSSRVKFGGRPNTSSTTGSTVIWVVVAAMV
jgi:hypothetical protein